MRLTRSEGCLADKVCDQPETPSANVTTRRLPAEKRRKQILRSAIRVFAQATYHGATTKRIAEEAGVTEALIYRYFGSKRALFTDAVQDSSAWLADGLIAVLDEHGEDPQRTATECFAYYVRVLERHEDLAKMIFLVLSELDQPDIRAAYLPHQTRALKAIGLKVKHWRSQGLVDEELAPEGTAWLLFGTYLILALIKHSHGELSVPPAYVLKLVRPYLNLQALHPDEDEAS